MIKEDLETVTLRPVDIPKKNKFVIDSTGMVLLLTGFLMGLLIGVVAAG